MKDSCERLWTHADVMGFLGIKSRSTLHKLRSASRIPYLKIPGVGIRYSEEDIMRWLKERKIRPHKVWR